MLHQEVSTFVIFDVGQLFKVERITLKNKKKFMIFRFNQFGCFDNL